MAPPHPKLCKGNKEVSMFKSRAWDSIFIVTVCWPFVEFIVRWDCMVAEGGEYLVVCCYTGLALCSCMAGMGKTGVLPTT